MEKRNPASALCKRLAAFSASAVRDLWGSTGCQPVLFGSLPKSSSNVRHEEFWQDVGLVGKLPTTTGWQPVLPGTDALPACGIDGFWVCGWRRFQAKNCFAFLHEIETIARDGFQIGHVGLEKVDLASLTREQTLLPVQLLLQLVDFGAALHQLFVRWNKQAYNHEPDRED